MLTAAILLFIVFVLLVSALTVIYKKALEFYDKMCVFQTRLKLEETVNRTDRAHRELLVELTDSLQVLMSDITDEDKNKDAAIARFKKDIDRICSKTPSMYWNNKN